MNDIISTAPSIASAAMLVELNISVWTGRKLDRNISAEIDAQKNTTTRVVNAHKKLFADEPKHEAIGKFAGNSRTYHYTNTMPWSNSGTVLLPTASFAEYNAHMSGAQTKFYELVDECLDEWDDMLLRAHTKLGAMFNYEDYPSKEDVRDRYRFSINYLPVPDVGDFRVSVGNDALQYLNESYATYYKDQLDKAYSDVWERTHTVLKNMSEKLAGQERQVFRDSLVGNVREMIDLLDKFNITGDPKMKQAKARIEAMVTGITPDALREDNALRHDVKHKVDDLLKQFSW